MENTVNFAVYPILYPGEKYPRTLHMSNLFWPIYTYVSSRNSILIHVLYFWLRKKLPCDLRTQPCQLLFLFCTHVLDNFEKYFEVHPLSSVLDPSIAFSVVSHFVLCLITSYKCPPLCIWSMRTRNLCLMCFISSRWMGHGECASWNGELVVALVCSFVCLFLSASDKLVLYEMRQLQFKITSIILANKQVYGTFSWLKISMGLRRGDSIPLWVMLPLGR